MRKQKQETFFYYFSEKRRKKKDFDSLRSSVCDGVIDCRNGIDEQCTQRNPLITCTRNEYHCQITNRCIPKIWLCNRINDCLDPYASDELGK
jgi:hypothetical protein